MYKIIMRFFCPLFILCLLIGCSTDQHQKRQAHFQEWTEDNGKVKVLSTTGMINDLVRQIGGPHVDTMTLIQGELDPHSYQLVKGDDEKVGFAQIIFYNGLELEHGPSLHRYLIENPKALSLGDSIDRAHPGAVIDVRGQKDPHIWMDVSVWSKAVPFIVQALSRQDPQHADIYRENGLQLHGEMEKAHAQIRGIMQQVPSDKRFLVTSHDAFHYFARAYLADEWERESGEWKKRFAAPEGLAPESQLSAGDIKAIIEHLHRYQIGLLFPETNVSKDSIRKIVEAGRGHGLKLTIACCPLYGDAMGPPGSEGDTYLKMLLHNARTLSNHMEPALAGPEKTGHENRGENG